MNFVQKTIRDLKFEPIVLDTKENEYVFRAILLGTVFLLEVVQLYKKEDQEKHYKEWVTILIEHYSKHVPDYSHQILKK